MKSASAKKSPQLLGSTCSNTVEPRIPGELKGEVVVPFLSTLLYVSHFFLGRVSAQNLRITRVIYYCGG